MHASWGTDELGSAKLLPFQALAKENVESERPLLGGHVADLRVYWQSKRQVVHTTPKVGRNDPCPCGSGRKHKKCCLAKQA